MELHQSPVFVKYITLLKWDVVTVDGAQIFIKRFPFVGGLAKIQRAYPLPNINLVLPIIKKYGIKRFVVEASEREDEATVRSWVKKLKEHTAIISSPYLPSKTIRIDLTASEEKIFKSFTEAKQRGVRRAKKNTIIIKEIHGVDELITIKSCSAGFLGFITTYGLKELWQAFGEDHATTVLGYTADGKLLGGILLLFWEDIAYYWIAGATRQGKKLFVPTLLAWEAIKISKQRGSRQFDWVGVWDERFPKDNTEWKGFTKFKEGFGGTPLYYPTHRN